MPTTIIGYKPNQGFYIDEAEMELVFYFIWKTISMDTNEYDFKSDIEKEAKTSMESGFYGYLVILWDKYLKTNEHELQMISLLEKCITEVKAFGEYIPLTELKIAASKNPQVEYRSNWSKPLKTSEVIKVLDALISMIRGEWESDNFDMKFDYDGTIA